MADYRFYAVTPDGRLIGFPIEAECSDDDAAVSQAKQFLKQSIIEVWQRARRVAVLVPIDQTTGNFDRAS